MCRKGNFFHTYDGNSHQADINASPASQLMISQMFGLSCRILTFSNKNIVFKNFDNNFIYNLLFDKTKDFPSKNQPASEARQGL